MSESDMTFPERSLDDFADHIITRARPSADGTRWYAVLDYGLDTFRLSPDFSSCARTKAEAIRICAANIRGNARGDGTRATRSILREEGYDIGRLKQHWSAKEEIELLGLSYESILESAKSVAAGKWKIIGQSWAMNRRKTECVEFHFIVSCLAKGTIEDIVERTVLAGGYENVVRSMLANMTGHELMALCDPSPYLVQ